jgi:hypothetical protein
MSAVDIQRKSFSSKLSAENDGPGRDAVSVCVSPYSVVVAHTKTTMPDLYLETLDIFLEVERRGERVWEGTEPFKFPTFNVLKRKYEKWEDPACWYEYAESVFLFSLSWNLKLGYIIPVWACHGIEPIWQRCFVDGEWRFDWVKQVPVSRLSLVNLEKPETFVEAFEDQAKKFEKFKANGGKWSVK